MCICVDYYALSKEIFWGGLEDTPKNIKSQTAGRVKTVFSLSLREYRLMKFLFQKQNKGAIPSSQR